MRENPVYATTIVGRPPMEDYYLGHATERIFLPLLKLTIPEIVDYHMPAEGIFHNLVFVSIDKQYPGQAYKVMNAMWGQGLMSLAKVLVIVDKDVNVRDPQEAWWVALNNIDPERDARFTMGPIDVLDHSSRAFTYGSKMGLDATRKWPEEGFARHVARRVVMDAATDARVDARVGGARHPARCDERPVRHPPQRAEGRVSETAPVREGQTFAGRVALHAVRQFREAAAHGVRAAVRARGRDAGELHAAGHVAGRGLGRRRVHGGAIRGDGVQPHRRSPARREESAHGRCARSRAARWAWAKPLAVTVAAAVFVVAAWRLNPLCYVLSPFALGWVLCYSYTKRFTHWSHLVLGLGIGIAPVGGYLAVTGAWSDPWWVLVALAAAVMGWTGGFDILYALQDVEFDRANGLHSLPVTVGRARALCASRACCT